jgi:hypothetical protein
LVLVRKLNITPIDCECDHRRQDQVEIGGELNLESEDGNEVLSREFLEKVLHDTREYALSLRESARALNFDILIKRGTYPPAQYEWIKQ